MKQRGMNRNSKIAIALTVAVVAELGFDTGFSGSLQVLGLLIGVIVFTIAYYVLSGKW